MVGWKLLTPVVSGTEGSRADLRGHGTRVGVQLVSLLTANSVSTRQRDGRPERKLITSISLQFNLTECIPKSVTKTKD